MKIERFTAAAAWVARGRALMEGALALSLRRGAGHARLCLAGGQTPEGLYRSLASLRFHGLQVDLYAGDEREVAADSPSRNGRMIREAFTGAAWAPPPRLVPWSEGSATEAALQMDRRIRCAIGSGDAFFDLVVLGIGEDGHTAGLFPGDPAVSEKERFAIASTAPVEPRSRMSFTIPALVSTRAMFFFLRGPGKAAIVDALEAGGSGLPAEALANAAQAVKPVILYCGS